MTAIIDETGNRYGRWTVVRRSRRRPSDGYRSIALWHVRCDCGARGIVSGPHLRRGESRGCRPCDTAARTAPEEERVCAWCGRPSSRSRGPRSTAVKVRECGACERMACRNGRDRAGRPIAKGKRRVTQEAS